MDTVTNTVTNIDMCILLYGYSYKFQVLAIISNFDSIIY